MTPAKKTVSKSAETTKKVMVTRAAKAPETIKNARIPSPEKSSEELVIENFSALTQTVDALTDTLEMLVHKIESMAYHVIATEEVLAEVVASNGLNLARVNARIRAKIAAGTDGTCDVNRAVDVAAAIASPLPRR